MGKQYTFFELIIDVFKNNPNPMSADEVWEKALEMKLDKKLGTFGKTPSATVGARLYVDIKEKGDQSTFIQVSKRPARFLLRSMNLNQQLVKSQVEKVKQQDENILLRGQEKNFDERDLHPLLAKYVYEHPHFRCYVKTIHQECSTRRPKGTNEWLHPDLVGVYFPFGDYLKKTIELQRSLNVNSLKLFSFEMKKHLDYGNLRQCFFQAVSNSSWANEGYLVCLKMNSDPDFKNEIQRLSNAFGIGIIKLNAEDITDSEIICQARYNESIDWDTLDRLAEDSPEFNDFVTDITEDIAVKKAKSNYDEILSDEKFVAYLKEKKILSVF